MKTETRHHCKPRSIGGTDCDKNISIVPKLQHRAWHNLFGNISAPQIAHRLGRLFPDYVFLAIPKKEIYTIVLPENAQHYTKSKALVDKSIAILWGNWNVPRICDNINQRWLDKDYYIHALKIVSR